MLNFRVGYCIASIPDFGICEIHRTTLMTRQNFDYDIYQHMVMGDAGFCDLVGVGAGEKRLRREPEDLTPRPKVDVTGMKR